MKNPYTSLLAGALLFTLSYAAKAQTLVSYTPDDTLLVDPGVVNPVEAGKVTAGGLTYGPGFSFSAGPGFPQQAYGSNTNSFDAPFYGSNNPESLSAAITGGTYFTFSVAPAHGDLLNLTDVDFSDASFYSNGETDTFVLESSVTGFGSSAGDILASYTVPSGGGSVNGALVPLALNAGFVGQTGNVEFRIYEYGSSDLNPYQLTGIQGDGSSNTIPGKFYIDGVATITPEPSTYALMSAGLGILAIVALRRRSRRV